MDWGALLCGRADVVRGRDVGLLQRRRVALDGGSLLRGGRVGLRGRDVGVLQRPWRALDRVRLLRGEREPVRCGHVWELYGALDWGALLPVRDEG